MALRLMADRSPQRRQDLRRTIATVPFPATGAAAGRTVHYYLSKSKIQKPAGHWSAGFYGIANQVISYIPRPAEMLHKPGGRRPVYFQVIHGISIYPRRS